MKQDDRRCTNDGCEKPLRARGLCVSCYGKAREAGLPKVREYRGRRKTIRASLEDRYWAKVIKDASEPHPELGPCWGWQGSTVQGYGRLGRGQRQDGIVLATHVSWEIHFPDKPLGADYVLHKCDNPPCTNPNHLFEGTHGENMEDKRLKGRIPLGSAHYKTNLTEQLVRDIRSLKDSGLTRREIAETLDVSYSSVKHVVARNSWTHVI